MRSRIITCSKTLSLPPPPTYPPVRSLTSCRRRRHRHTIESIYQHMYVQQAIRPNAPERHTDLTRGCHTMRARDSREEQKKNTSLARHTHQPSNNNEQSYIRLLQENWKVFCLISSCSVARPRCARMRCMCIVRMRLNDVCVTLYARREVLPLSCEELNCVLALLPTSLLNSTANRIHKRQCLIIGRFLPSSHTCGTKICIYSLCRTRDAACTAHMFSHCYSNANAISVSSMRSRGHRH